MLPKGVEGAWESMQTAKRLAAGEAVEGYTLTLHYKKGRVYWTLADEKGEPAGAGCSPIGEWQRSVSAIRAMSLSWC